MKYSFLDLTKEVLEKSVFYQSNKRPAKFYLKAKKDSIKETDKFVKKDNKTAFSERDLHILLSSFVQMDSLFKCQTKTIYHEKSSRAVKGKNQWLHPDMVGVYYPFVDISRSITK